jgi:hypothetical protein
MKNWKGTLKAYTLHEVDAKCNTSTIDKVWSQVTF